MRSSCFSGQAGKAIGKAGDVITIKLESPRLWSPDDPFLYKIQVGRKTKLTESAIAIVGSFRSGWTQFWRLGQLLCWSPDHSSCQRGRKADHTSQWKTSGFSGCNQLPYLNSFTIQIPSTGSNMNYWLQFFSVDPVQNIFM